MLSLFLCDIYLRQHCVNELKGNKEYNHIMPEEDVEVIDDHANKGVLSNNIGDLMLKVCSEVLGIPLIAITSVKEMGIATNFPGKNQLYHIPLYLAFDATASGHYDAITEIDFKDTGIESCKYIFLKKFHCKTSVDIKSYFNA